MSTYNVAFYIRLSIGEQSKGYSLEGQKSILETWAKDSGWKWLKTYTEVASAKDLEREKFQEMITDAKNGLYNGICIVDSDRFSRSTKDLLNIMDDLYNKGVKLHIHNLQHIDIYSEQGRLMLTNLAAYSEFFRKQLATKIRSGIKQKMKSEWFGQAPFGYKIVSDDIDGRKRNTRLIENPEEQKVMQKMRELRNNGRSYNEIAEYLNENKIKTRHTTQDKKSDWHSSTIRNILTRKDIILEDTKEKN